MSALELAAAPRGARAAGGAGRRPRRRRDAGRRRATTERSSTRASATCRASSRPGDLLVVNTSATLPAALTARLGDRASSSACRLRSDAGTWVVELRTRDRRRRLRRPPVGARLELPGGGTRELLAPYAGSDRLVVARLVRRRPLERLPRAATAGRSATATCREPWPIEAYQTVFALEPGQRRDAERRPAVHGRARHDAGRTRRALAPLTLHTGVSSPELGEPPYPERYRVPETTARLVNAVHGWGGRVIAVGTTVVRALETVADATASSPPAQGCTGLVVTPERGLARRRPAHRLARAEASHLLMLEAAAGAELLARSYERRRARGYLWHEFGDLHLILP